MALTMLDAPTGEAISTGGPVTSETEIVAQGALPAVLETLRRRLANTIQH